MNLPKVKPCTCGVRLTTRNVERVKRLKDEDSGVDQLCVTCRNCKSSTIIFRPMRLKIIKVAA